MEKIGFVGVGRMGANMARRLKDQGFTVSAVYDVNQPAAQTLAQELGATACADLKDVTKLSDVIITVVTDDKAMKSIFLGGLLSRSKGKLFINCATVSPATHVWVEQKAEKAGAQSLEACMASSITQAREGTLYLMCGGKEEAFNRAKPILEKLAGSMRYVGGAGKAAQVKALVNMVMNINTAGLAEGPWTRCVAWFGFADVARSFFTNRREFARPGHRRRRHAEPRSQLFLFRRARREGFGHRVAPRPRTGIEPSAGRRDQKAIRQNGRSRSGRIG